MPECLQRLEDDGLLAEIVDACRSRNTVYSVSDLSIPGLRHFVYKSRAHVQITMPLFEEPYDDITERRRWAACRALIYKWSDRGLALC